jgi:hypothetical protein
MFSQIFLPAYGLFFFAFFNRIFYRVDILDFNKVHINFFHELVFGILYKKLISKPKPCRPAFVFLFNVYNLVFEHLWL